MNRFLFAIFSMIACFAFGQNINMQNGGTFTQCSGVFYDSGGATGDYGDNQNFEITICPDTPGQKLQLQFTTFNTQANTDILSIYDGNSNLAPIIGFYSGPNTPGIIRATTSNSSGCLTIQFTSNTNTPSTGWAANIQCYEPCQSITAQLDMATPSPNMDGYIRVCPNESITLEGSGVFSDDGTGATYEWDLGDGRTIAGQNATFSYPSPGVYIANLYIRDTNTSVYPSGCPNTNLINQVIQVGNEPDFTGTQAANTTICFGDSTTIEGVVTPIEYIEDCTPPVSGANFLPDGTGVSYETQLSVECFGSSQTLTDINQLLSICLNMEHSFLGDLTIEIISPNGQSVVMHNSVTNSGAASANLGTPWAAGQLDQQSSNTTPGIGGQYCFVPGNANPTLEGGVQAGGVFTFGNGPSTYVDGFVPDGDYSSINPLSDLVGSPLNGIWVIRITDNFPEDNGYIFGWELNFDPSIQPANLSFTPTITTEAWDADPSITNAIGNIITVQPATSGTHCYAYRAMDDFGCEYTEQVCIDVLPEIVTATPNDLFACDTGGPYIFDLTQNTPVIIANSAVASDLVVTYHTSLANANSGTPSITSPGNYSGNDGQIIYARIEYQNSGCFEIETFTLNLTNPPTINPVPDLETCDESSNDGFEPFNLEIQTLTILGAQPDTDFNVTYHNSLSDADSGANSLASPFTNTVNPQVIYVRVERATEPSCYSASQLFSLNVDYRAIANQPANLEACDDVGGDGVEQFDLTSQDVTILGNQDSMQFTVSYYENQLDADAGTNVIPNPTTYSNTGSPQTIFARIEENSNPICFGTTTFDLIVNPLPSFVTPTPLEACDDDSLDGIADFDLTLKDAEITAGDANLVVSYFEIFSDADTDANSISSPGSFSGMNGQIIYVRIEDQTTGCYEVETFTLNLTNPPTINPVPDLETCDDSSNDGFEPFDLESQTLTILGTQPDTDFNVTYYTSLADADSGANSLSSPFTNTINPQVIYVRIERTTEPSCYSASQLFTLNVNYRAIANQPANLEACDTNGDGAEAFDLTTQDVTILGNQDSILFTVSYYENQLDADAGTNAIPNPTTYSNTGSPQTIFARIEENSNPICFGTTTFDLIVNPLPSFVTPTPLETCDDDTPDGIAEFDLTSKDAEITAGNTNLVVSYYETNTDAQLQSNVITNPTTYINRSINALPANPQTLYLAVTDVNTSCISYATLTLNVIPNPTPNTNPNDLILCDDINPGDLQEVFDLTVNESYILNGQMGVTASYHSTQSDAETGANGISNPTGYTNISSPQTIYVRITDDVTSCFTVVTFDLYVSPSPQASPITDFVVCEDNSSGFYAFDLESKTAEALNGQDPQLYTVTYHETQADADNLTNPLISPYTNTINPQQIFVAITDTFSGCSISSPSFLIEVQEIPEANSDAQPIAYTICDNIGNNDGFAQFDLTTQNANVLDGQDPVNFTVTYFASFADANMGINPLPTIYENITNPQTLYARVDDDSSLDSVCYAITDLTLDVVLLPEFDLDDSYVLCVNSNGTEVISPPILDTGLSNTNYSFEWSLDGMVISGETNSSLVPNQAGNYVATVTDNTTGCQSSDSALVTESMPPTLVLTNVNTDAFASNNIVEVSATGAGEYEFRLDFGPWQDSGTFENVTGGEHIVTARDKIGCGLASTTVMVIDYPLYFTPNGDSFNDTWNVKGLENQANVKIYIFDRFGKLLKEISASGDGWNGTFNGALMPSSDYWFKVIYNEPVSGERKEFNSHFSLKR